MMKDGLPVAADQGDSTRRDSEAAAGGKRSVGKQIPETEIQLAEFASGDLPAFGDTQDFFAHRGWKLEGRVAEEFRAELRRLAGDTSKGNVDSVSRRTGHEAKEQRRL